MSTLVTGPRGLLGSEVCSVFGAEATADDVDITDEAAVATAIQRAQPEWVINCAAYTAVDAAENDWEKCYLVNAAGPKILARSAKNAGARLLQVSTDFVFDGEKRRPYVETDAPNPLNFYGASKLLGEALALEENEATVVLRSAWLFGAGGECFPKKIIHAAREKRPLRIVYDQVGSPTYTKDLAIAISQLVGRDVDGGIYHYANSGEASWYDLAKAALESAGIAHELQPVPSSDWPAPARRPQYSVLSTGKIKSIGLDEPRHWKESLYEFIRTQA